MFTCPHCGHMPRRAPVGAGGQRLDPPSSHRSVPGRGDSLCGVKHYSEVDSRLGCVCISQARGLLGLGSESAGMCAMRRLQRMESITLPQRASRLAT